VSNASAQSYERFEWVGDAYLYLISTLLISSTFTSHLPGKCAQLRELLVKNETLANYAKHYNFEARARLPAEFRNDGNGKFSASSKATRTEKVKVMGDIFEAYVAAVILSDPKDGVNRVSAWLKSIWAMTLSKEIREQAIRTSQNLEPGSNINAKDRLSKEIGCKGVKISYKDAGPEEKDPETGHPIFTVAVLYHNLGEREVQLGIGKAKGKGEAGMKAAEAALKAIFVIKELKAHKTVVDERVRAEKQAQLSLSNS